MLTPLTVTHGTYSWAGFSPPVLTAFSCISLFPTSPFTQDMIEPHAVLGEYSLRH